MVPSRLRWRKGVNSLEAKHKLMDLRIISLSVALVGLAALSWVAYDPLDHSYHHDGLGGGRSLLSGGNKADWETCDFESTNAPVAWTILYITATLHLFVGIAILCDDYFVPVLEDISAALKLSDDVAGATFMAAGSSAPELFTSLAGVSVDSDVGVGTIVGSAVFNILIIISMSAFFGSAGGKGPLQVDWRCIVRDSIHYGISIVVLIIFLWDGQVTWWESLILILLYFLYLLNMKFNQQIFKMIPLHSGAKVGAAPTEVDENATVNPSTDLCKVPSVAIIDAGGGKTTVQDFESRSPSPMSRKPSALSLLAAGDPDSRFSSRRTSSLNGLNEDVSSFLAQKLEKELDDLDGPGAAKLDKSMSASEGALNRVGLDGTLEPGATKSFHAGPPGRLSAMMTGRGLVIRQEILKRRSNQVMAGSTADLHLSSKVLMNQPAAKVEADAATAATEADGDRPTTCREKCCYPCAEGLPGLDDDDERIGCKKILGLLWVRFKYFLTLVYEWLFVTTIPSRKLYWSCFAVCILWIMIISFIMVTAVIRLGCILAIDDYVMGLVIIAAGTSVPDAMGSILVVNQGFADMAVANALGSNVFDIDLGIGVPFLIKCLLINKSFDVLSSDDRIAYDTGAITITDHVKFGFILLGILCVTLVIFKALSFKLNKTLGVGFMLMYVLFITYALVQEIVCKRAGDRC